MKPLSWINFILGLWLIVAGFALSAGVRPVMAEEIVMGIIIAVLAYVSAVARPNAGLSWIVVLAGLWTLIAPAAINYMGRNSSRSNDIAVGIVVLILGVINAIYRQAAAPLSHA
jgi:hypothetical protein